MIALKIEEIKNIFGKEGYRVLTNEYSNAKDELLLEDKEGYLYQMPYVNFYVSIIKNKSHPLKFGNSNKKSYYNLELFLKSNSRSISIHSEYDSDKYLHNKKMTFSDVDGYLYHISPFNLIQNIKKEMFPNFVDSTNKYSTQNIARWLKNNSKSFSLLEDQKYVNGREKLLFKCHVCPKDEVPFSASWENIYFNGIGCSICCSRQIGKYNNLLYNFPEVCDEWDYQNNSVSPDKVFPKTGKKFWWVCKKCKNSYLASPAHRLISETGCPRCIESKGEKRIFEFLNKNKILFVKQHRFPDCINKRPLPFDFYLPNYKICIEYQGEQHFEYREFFGDIESYKLLVKNDKIKKKYCKKMNIKLLDIPYWEYNNIEKILEKNLFYE